MGKLSDLAQKKMWNYSLATLPQTRLGSIPIELILLLNVASQQHLQTIKGNKPTEILQL